MYSPLRSLSFPFPFFSPTASLEVPSAAEDNVELVAEDNSVSERTILPGVFGKGGMEEEGNVEVGLGKGGVRNGGAGFARPEPDGSLGTSAAWVS